MIKLAPSVLSADFANLAAEVTAVVAAGAQYVHIDVMDGHFVPNITLGPPVIKSLRKTTDAVFDVHLMIEEPHRYINAFAEAGADIINVHAEACRDIVNIVSEINKLGKKAGVTIKPKTPVEAVFPVIEDVDLILVMSVEPGFGGQTLIADTLMKLKALKRIIVERGFRAELEIDGGVGLRNLDLVLDHGADIIVAGEAIFGSESPVGAVREFLARFEEFENKR